MKNILEIKNLSFAYDGDTVLEDISLTVNKYDFLAIIGPNGGGKTTLLKLMLGVLQPQKGEISIEGKSPVDARSLIGYVPQNTNVNIDFPIKVIEVVLMGHVGGKRPFWGYGKDEISCAMGSLKEVGMEAYAKRKIGDLSGGQRQRVMIARALCANPDILILDEPTSSIDARGQKEIYSLLKELDKNITVVVVSHDITVILEYATRAAYVNKQLTYHDISDKSHLFHTHGKNEHFCEVELLEMLGAKGCEKCDDDSNQTNIVKNNKDKKEENDD